MKFFIPLFIFFSFILCQEYEDVIYLKDGSEIHGMIIEQRPNEYIKIQSGSNIFVYEINQIEKITKEKIKEVIDPIKNKNLSVSIGILDPTLNFISVTNDFSLDKDKRLYGSIGAGLGINWVYAGIKYEPNYNQTGLSTMLIGGGFIDSWGDLQLVGTLSTSYQYRFGKSPIFFNLGISTALRMDTWDGSIYWLVGPVISLKGHF